MLRITELTNPADGVGSGCGCQKLAAAQLAELGGGRTDGPAGDLFPSFFARHA